MDTRSPDRAPRGAPACGDERGHTAVFVAAAIAALFVAIPVAMWLALPPADLTQAERLGAEIGCTCGTCPHRPIATCGCGFADGMLARLDSEVAAGKTDAEIMAAFIADYGNGIKIKPESTGFGLMAWAAPIALLMVGAVAMAGVIAQWRSNPPAPSLPPADETGADGAAADAPGGPEASARSAADADRFRDIVDRELDAFGD